MGVDGGGRVVYLAEAQHEELAEQLGGGLGGKRLVMVGMSG